MDQNACDPSYLRRQAELCELVSLGVSDPALIKELRKWAADYRLEADYIEQHRLAA